MRRRAFCRTALAASALGFPELGFPELGFPALGRATAAEQSTIRLSKQYGLPYLPMMLIEQRQLIEKHAAALGLPPLRVEWQTHSGPAAQLDALLSGQTELIGPGVPTLATVWDKTAGTPLEVRALCAMQSMPYVLVTRNPDVTTIADFTEKDRIALPGVKLTGHALALEIAAAKLWGAEHYDKLDPLTVTMAHPDAMTALLSGRSEIDSHFASAPFYYYELATPGIRQVLKSYDAVGGRHTNGVLLGSKRFHDANPQICAAVLAAFAEANTAIKADPRGCAALYLELTHDKKNGVADVAKMVADPDVEYTATPVKVMAFVEFMHRVGRIKHKPADWRELFFAEAHGLDGS
jgi:NitT/TauT family transport system substrate-binding protein